VNAPQKPVVSANFTSGLIKPVAMDSSLTSPNTKQPLRLIRKVLTGKFVTLFCSSRMVNRNLRVVPQIPPAITQSNIISLLIKIEYLPHPIKKFNFKS
jgi:hypothetical protein